VLSYVPDDPTRAKTARAVASPHKLVLSCPDSCSEPTCPHDAANNQSDKHNTCDRAPIHPYRLTLGAMSVNTFHYHGRS